MVSNESRKISPYELFQEFSKLRAEGQQLRERLETIKRLKVSIGVQLAELCSGSEASIADTGVVEVDGQLYYYAICLEDGSVDEFRAVSYVKQSA
ncbi:hypothetical protein Lepto7375DRAFT_4584 [Leptolyngbya sp. PCC 7375]|nr:hypothetical protein Lepto7375DRAFT_4584 [Leptolyngbya sp. PCC 7375]